jgi:hypothetical protein
MKKMKKIAVYGMVIFSMVLQAGAQAPGELLEKIRAKLARVKDYQAEGKMKTNVSFIKAPVANVKVYYKSPDKLRIRNEQGISFIPKGSVNVNLNSIFVRNAEYDIVDMGKQDGLRVLKLLPSNEGSDIVLSTLYIDEKELLVKKARTTTRENGTYELEMTYGKYAEYGLADRVEFTFNTRDYKLPKGITFDYDDGSKDDPGKRNADQKGSVVLSYSSYIINKGVPDSVFN